MPTDHLIDIISQEYDPADVAVAGMYQRLRQVRVMLIPGRGNEFYHEDNESLPIGRAYVGKGDVVAFPGVKLPKKLAEVDDRFSVSIGGIEEEMRNIYTALDWHCMMIKENPSIHNGQSDSILALHDNPEQILETAIRLNFARRILKYGLLHADMLQGPH